MKNALGEGRLLGKETNEDMGALPPQIDLKYLRIVESWIAPCADLASWPEVVPGWE